MVRTLADALRDFDDERLAELLDARRDLTRQAPTGIAALASRAAQSGSVHRALGVLRRPELQLAEALAAENRPLSPEGLAHAVSATTEAIAPHVFRLATLALVFIDESGRFVAPVRTLSDAIPHPAGLAPVLSTDPSASEAQHVVADLPENLREVAEKLAWGPARISGSPTSPLARALMNAGLAATTHTPDGQRLLTPRPVHLELRGHVVHREFARLPVPNEAATPEMYAGARDAQGLDAALEADRIAMSLGHWHADPPQVLKRGGVPVRDMKRLATAAGTDLTVWTTVVHAAWVASLVGHDGDTWQVTRDFARAMEAPVPERWADLVIAWARGNYVGSVAGTRLGEEGADASSQHEAIRAGLSSAVGRTGVKTRRKHLLRIVADFPDQHCTDDVLARSLAWAFPTIPGAVIREEATAFAREAAVFGLVADDAPTSLGLALAATDDMDIASAITHMTTELDALLPVPVDNVILDSDLSMTVPGLPSAPVAKVLEWATVLTRGAGITARFTAESIGRAIDSGEDPDHVIAELEKISLTGVPQPLEYLIKDVARSRGQVHVGTARAVITGEEEHLDHLMAAPEAASLSLVRLAPTVISTTAEPSYVMGQIRQAGLAPLVTGADGRPVAARSPGVLHGGPLPLELESDAAEAELEISAAQAVARIRAGDAGALENLSVSQRILSAISTGDPLRMGIVDGRGGMQVVTAIPLSLDGGRLHAREVPANGADSGREFTVLIHRVTLA